MYLVYELIYILQAQYCFLQLIYILKDNYLFYEIEETLNQSLRPYILSYYEKYYILL